MENFDGPYPAFSFYACCGARRDEGDGHLFCRQHPDIGHVRETWANLEAPPCVVCAAWPKDRRYLWAASVFATELGVPMPGPHAQSTADPESLGGGQGEQCTTVGSLGDAAMVGRLERYPSPRGEEVQPGEPTSEPDPEVAGVTGEEDVTFDDFFPVFLERALASTGTVRKSSAPPSATPGVDKVFATASMEVGVPNHIPQFPPFIDAAKVTWQDPGNLRATVKGAAKDLTVAGWSPGSLPPPPVEPFMPPILYKGLRRPEGKDGAARIKHPTPGMVALDDLAKQVWFSGVKASAALSSAGLAAAHLAQTIDRDSVSEEDTDAARLDEAWRAAQAIGCFLRDAAVNTGAAMASSTLLRRAMWTTGCDLEPGMVKKLMGFPVTTQGLFAIDEEAMADLRKQHEEDELLSKTFGQARPQRAASSGAPPTQPQGGRGRASRRRKGYGKGQASGPAGRGGGPARPPGTGDAPPEPKKGRYEQQPSRSHDGGNRRSSRK